MTLGLVGFFGVYYLLFLLCMHTPGVDLLYGQLFAAYAIGRLLTAVGITPGGLGVTEAARRPRSSAWGADPADALAGGACCSRSSPTSWRSRWAPSAGRPGRSAPRARTPTSRASSSRRDGAKDAAREPT